MNKELYGNNYEIPSNILKNLENYKENETISNLVNNQSVTYSNLKKIKNRMENGEINEMGGQDFLNWVNQTLSSDRTSIDMSKKSKKESGQSNAYLSSHSKRNDIRPSERHRKTSEKYDTWDDNSSLRLEQRVIEELKIINNLIKKLI